VDETAGVVSSEGGSGSGIAKVPTVFETPLLHFTVIDNSSVYNMNTARINPADTHRTFSSTTANLFNAQRK